VLIYRFGVFGAPRLTLKQVAELFRAQKRRATKEWIHQLEQKAKEKVARYFKSRGFRSSDM